MERYITFGWDIDGLVKVIETGSRQSLSIILNSRVALTYDVDELLYYSSK